jgi:hypothetical protein
VAYDDYFVDLTDDTWENVAPDSWTPHSPPRDVAISNVASDTSVANPTVQPIWTADPNNVALQTSVGTPTVEIGTYGDVFVDSDDDSWVSTADDFWYPDTGGVSVSINNVASATSVDTLNKLIRTRLISPSNVASETSITNPTITGYGFANVNPNNVASETSVGSPTVTAVGEVYFTDDTAFEFVDDDEFKWSPFAAVNVYPNNVASATSVDTLDALIRTRLITPNNVSSTPDVTNPIISHTEAITATPTNVASATSVTSPSAQRVVTVTPTNVASATSVSTPEVDREVYVNANNVAIDTAVNVFKKLQPIYLTTPNNVSAETTVGTPTITVNPLVAAANVSAGTSIGNPQVTRTRDVTPNNVVCSTLVRNERVYLYGYAVRRGELLLLKAA